MKRMGSLSLTDVTVPSAFQPGNGQKASIPLIVLEDSGRGFVYHRIQCLLLAIASNNALM